LPDQLFHLSPTGQAALSSLSDYFITKAAYLSKGKSLTGTLLACIKNLF
jgi:hypothetical protein